MLSPDVRFEGFTQADWARFLSLFSPRKASGAPRDPDRPRGGIIAVSSRGRLWKLTHTEVGRLRTGELSPSWPLGAEELARRHHASWAMTIEAGALEAIAERFGARARRGEDLTVQLLSLLQLAREEIVAGRIELWPFRLRGVPVPAPAVVRATLDAVCPVGRSMLLGLFEDGELWTSVAVRRGPDGIDLVLGPDELRRDMGLLSGDWRRDYRHLVRSAEDRTGPLALGCYAEAGTIRRLVVDPTPGAWAKAAAIRDVILAPLPPALAIPLGLDAGRAAFSAARSLAERFDPVGVVFPTFETLRHLGASMLGHAQRRPGDEAGSGAFGWRPLELLRRLLSRDE